MKYNAHNTCGETEMNRLYIIILIRTIYSILHLYNMEKEEEGNKKNSNGELRM